MNSRETALSRGLILAIMFVVIWGPAMLGVATGVFPTDHVTAHLLALNTILLTLIYMEIADYL